MDRPWRWARYVLDALIETTVARDVLLLTRVDKPALLRHLFELGCRFSGRILSYNKMLGRLQDAGNTVTPAHLANAAEAGTCEVHYWRDGNREADLVVRAGRHLTAIEVKSGCRRDSLPGLAAFDRRFHPTRKLLLGGDGIDLEEFLEKPVEHWVG